MENDRELEDAAALPPEELSDALAEEIAMRWDPERILKLVATRAGKGEALDATLRNRYERKLGVDLSHVRVYTGELAEEVNKAYNAHAVTIGNTGMILMGGTDKMNAGAEQQALLAHELTHVAQAQRGVFRDARDGAMPLASAEHEAEAHAVQEQELSEARGGHNEAEAAKDAEEQVAHVKEQVLMRVIDMLGEAGRVMLDRGGPFLRRP